MSNHDAYYRWIVIGLIECVVRNVSIYFCCGHQQQFIHYFNGAAMDPAGRSRFDAIGCCCCRINHSYTSHIYTQTQVIGTDRLPHSASQSVWFFIAILLALMWEIKTRHLCVFAAAAPHIVCIHSQYSVITGLMACNKMHLARNREKKNEKKNRSQKCVKRLTNRSISVEFWLTVGGIECDFQFS